MLDKQSLPRLKNEGQDYSFGLSRGHNPASTNEVRAEDVSEKRKQKRRGKCGKRSDGVWVAQVMKIWVF